MTALDLLKGLKEHIECKVCENLKLQADNSAEYVNPYCVLMHIPNANFTPQGFAVPYIAIELDNATDSTTEHTLDIRITVAVYGGGYYKDVEDLNTMLPDDKGYIDLLNAIEKIKQSLLSEYTIANQGAIRKPISYGTYDTALTTYPYWYGYIKFTVDIPNNEFTVIPKESEDYLYGI